MSGLLASVVESTRAQPSRLSTYDDDPCMLLTSRSMCSRLCAAAVKLVGSCIHFSSLLSALALSLLVKPIAFPAARPGRVHYSLLHACEDRRHPIWDGCEAMYRQFRGSWLVLTLYCRSDFRQAALWLSTPHPAIQHLVCVRSPHHSVRGLRKAVRFLQIMSARGHSYSRNRPISTWKFIRQVMLLLATRRGVALCRHCLAQVSNTLLPVWCWLRAGCLESVHACAYIFATRF